MNGYSLYQLAAGDGTLLSNLRMIVFVCVAIHFVLIELMKVVARRIFDEKNVKLGGAGYTVVSLEHMRDRTLPAHPA
jgi:hypothetical protein